MSHSDELDPNELALAELGEDDGLDDDPVLPAPAPAPAQREARPRTPRERRRRHEPALPTAPLVHTPTAAQAADPQLTAEAQRIVDARRRGSGRRTMGIIALTVLVAAGAFGVRMLGSTQMAEAQQMPPANMAAGMGGGTSTPQPVDESIIAGLEERVAENPLATGTMNSLADLYFAANDYANAAKWHERVVEVDPKNVDSWMMLGISYYSMDDVDRAERSWAQALEVNPQTVEAYYNLGFLYMTTERPEQARAAWDKVLELAPGTALAQTVESHLATPQTGD